MLVVTYGCPIDHVTLGGVRISPHTLCPTTGDHIRERGDEEVRGERRGGKEGKGKSGARARWIERMRPREKVDKGERMRMRYDRGYEVERE